VQVLLAKVGKYPEANKISLKVLCQQLGICGYTTNDGSKNFCIAIGKK